MPDSDLLIDLDQHGVMLITFNRPEQMNSLSPDLTSGLLDALQRASEDDEVRAVVLRLLDDQSRSVIDHTLAAWGRTDLGPEFVEKVVVLAGRPETRRSAIQRMLGRLDPADFAGGTIPLSTDAAASALSAHVGGKLDMDPTTSVEEGHWTVNQKLITPGNVGLMSSSPSAPSDQKSIMMTNTSGGASQIVILRGANGSAPGSTDPAGRVIRMKIRDVEEVYDILSLGSQVVIRR